MGIVNYTKSQLKAIDGVESGKNILLTGRPGIGKTELLRDIVAKKQDEGEKTSGSLELVNSKT